MYTCIQYRHEPGGETQDATSISSYPLTLQVVDACGEKIAESSCCDSVPDAITAVPSMDSDPKYASFIPSAYCHHNQTTTGSWTVLH